MIPVLSARSCWSLSSILALLATITVMILAIFEPLGEINIWFVLPLAIGVGAWGIYRNLRSRDEVSSAAFKASVTVGAPLALALSALTVITAKYFAPLGAVITSMTDNAAPNIGPGLTGFAYGIAFSALVFSACVVATRTLWWMTKK